MNIVGEGPPEDTASLLIHVDHEGCDLGVDPLVGHPVHVVEKGSDSEGLVVLSSGLPFKIFIQEPLDCAGVDSQVSGVEALLHLIEVLLLEIVGAAVLVVETEDVPVVEVIVAAEIGPVENVFEDRKPGVVAFVSKLDLPQRDAGEGNGKGFKDLLDEPCGNLEVDLVGVHNGLEFVRWHPLSASRADPSESDEREEDAECDVREASRCSKVHKGGDGLDVLVPEGRRGGGELGTEEGGVPVPEEVAVVGREDGEEVVVAENLGARDLELDEGDLALIEVAGSHLRGGEERSEEQKVVKLYG